jgi:hypothetical protein
LAAVEALVAVVVWDDGDHRSLKRFPASLPDEVFLAERMTRLYSFY